MGPVTIAFGLFLILVGLAGYWFSESRSPTALIPAGFGLVLLVLGVLARRDDWRKHVMHAAVLVALAGAVGAGIMSLPKLFALIGGTPLERPLAVVSQALTALCCAVLVGLYVKSFIDARKARPKDDQVTR
jgi:hypothetical protein